VFEVAGDETAMLFELGIPVVETGDRWHYSVQQKVPLNVDRDNVTPSYMNSVRVAVFNQMYHHIDEEDTTSTWVKEASSDSRCVNNAVETLRIKQYGVKSVAFDPTNPEANAVAMSNGYIVIPSRGLTPGQRQNLKRAGTLKSSSTMFPTAGKGAYSDDPSATPVEVIPKEKWTKGMAQIHEYTVYLGKRLMGVDIRVQFVRCDSFVGNRWDACYGNRCFDYNLFTLGKNWFANGANEVVDALIIHEFGHEYESNHLCDGYYRALCRLGASLKAAVLADPSWFREFSSPKE
jgi:hypothetical protein